MSEYQRYEFMTVDQPLTKKQLASVDALSSHIEVSSTHAVVDYEWGDFKHDPIKVLRQFFDGFLYWANWGSPELAFRFPHGILPADLLSGYYIDDFATFTQHPDYDILDIQFGELEGPDEWIDYELVDMIAIREELIEGDLRALYIVWLASEPEEEDNTNTPPVPPAFGNLTEAQQALAELLQVPPELLEAAALHSKQTEPAASDDFAAWIKLLPAERSYDFLLRLANNEPSLSRQFTRELRELGMGQTRRPSVTTGEVVLFPALSAESQAIKARLERQKRERERQARLAHLKDIHDNQTTYWQQAEQAAKRGTGPGYDEALNVLVELRTSANQFNENEQFQKRFLAWIPSHLRRPALLKRLASHDFPLPETL